MINFLQCMYMLYLPETVVVLMHKNKYCLLFMELFLLCLLTLIAMCSW